MSQWNSHWTSLRCQCTENLISYISVMFEGKVCSGVAYLGCAWDHVQMPPTAAAATTKKLKGGRPATGVNLITPYIAYFISVLPMCLVSSGVQLFPLFFLTLMPDHQLQVHCGHLSHSVHLRPHHPPPSWERTIKTEGEWKIKQGSRARGGFVGSVVTLWPETTNKWVYGKS